MSRTYIDYPYVLTIMPLIALLAFRCSLDDITIKTEQNTVDDLQQLRSYDHSGYGDPTEANCGS